MGLIIIVLPIVALTGLYYGIAYYIKFNIDSDDRIIFKSTSPDGSISVSLVDLGFVDSFGYVYVRTSRFMMPYELNIRDSSNDGTFATEFAWSEDSRYLGLWAENKPIGGYDFLEKKYLYKIELYLHTPSKEFKDVTKTELIQRLSTIENRIIFLNEIVTERNLEIIKVIERYFRDLSQDSTINEIPFQHVENLNSEKMVQYLLENGVDLQLSNSFYSALYFNNWNIDILKYLIEQGMDVNVKDSNGNTPLLRLFMTDEYLELARILLENGADPYIMDRHGKNSFDRLGKKNSTKMKALLEQYKKPENDTIVR